MIGGQLTLIVGAAAMAMGLAGGLGIGRLHATQQVNKIVAAHALEQAQAARTAQQAEQAARAEEQRRVRALTEASDVAHDQAAQARADAVRAERAAVQLRRAYLIVAAALTDGRAAADPTVAGASAPAAGPGLVLSDLLGRGDRLLRQCAAALDQSRIAGLACERAYDALTP